MADTDFLKPRYVTAEKVEVLQVQIMAGIDS
jgi:hypothetical protein